MPKSIQNASDPELIDIATQSVTAMTANLPAYPNVTAQQVAALDTATDEFSTEFTGHVAQQAAGKAQTQLKDAKRDTLENLLSSIRNIANASGATKEAMLATGIPIVSEKAPANATQPVGSVDTSQRLRHTIRWTDAASPDNKKRPRGTIGVEIYLKLDGPPPIDQTQCTFLTIDSASPYLVEYDGADAGLMAHYMLRWRLTDGTASAWSETISATITG